MQSNELLKKIEESNTNEELNALWELTKDIKLRTLISAKRNLINQKYSLQLNEKAIPIEDALTEEGKVMNPFEFWNEVKKKEKKPTKYLEANLPEGNETALPNVLFDYFFPGMEEDDIRITLYLGRHTIGFKKDTDAIALKQIIHGIPGIDFGAGIRFKEGMKEKAKEMYVSRIIKRLEFAGMVIVYRGLKTEFTDRYATNHYRLNLKKLKEYKFTVTV